MCPLIPSASGHPHLLGMDLAHHVDLVSVVGLKVAFVTWQITTTVFTGYRLSANDNNLVCVSPSSTTGCIVKQGVRFHMLCSGVTTQYFFSMICSLAVNGCQVSLVPKAILRYFICNFQCPLVTFDRNRLVSCCFRIPSEDLESPRGPAGPVTVHSN